MDEYFLVQLHLRHPLSYAKDTPAGGKNGSKGRCAVFVRVDSSHLLLFRDAGTLRVFFNVPVHHLCITSLTLARTLLEIHSLITLLLALGTSIIRISNYRTLNSSSRQKEIIIN